MSQDASTQNGGVSAPPVLVLCRDLFFGSKITATSKACGVPVRMLRDPLKLAEQNTARRLIVDLNQPGYLEAAATWKQGTGGHVTGFVKHTDVQTIASAKAVGLDAIFSQGGFTAQLDSILKGVGASVDPAVG